MKKKKDMMDSLLEVEDEEGNKLTDEDIIDILVMYLNAGHESSGHTIMWATTYLQQHPEYFQKAKVLDFTLFFFFQNLLDFYPDKLFSLHVNFILHPYLNHSAHM